MKDESEMECELCLFVDLTISLGAWEAVNVVILVKPKLSISLLSFVT